MTQTPNQPETRRVEKWLEVYHPTGLKLYSSAVTLVFEGQTALPRNLSITRDHISYRHDGEAVPDYSESYKMSTGLHSGIRESDVKKTTAPDAITITGKNLTAIIKDC